MLMLHVLLLDDNDAMIPSTYAEMDGPVRVNLRKRKSARMFTRRLRLPCPRYQFLESAGPR